MNQLTNPYRLHRPLFHPSNVLHRGSHRHLEDLLQLVRFLLELALQHLRLVLLFLRRTEGKTGRSGKQRLHASDRGLQRLKQLRLRVIEWASSTMMQPTDHTSMAPP